MATLQTFLPQDLMSIAGAAKFLGRSIASLKRWMIRDDNPLPCYRVGGRIYISQSELKNWILRCSGRGGEAQL